MSLPCSSAGNPSEMSGPSEPIELLEVIEVTGTMVAKTPKTPSFPLPMFNHPWPNTMIAQLMLPDLHLVKRPQPNFPRLLLDQTGKTRGRFTSAQPVKMNRPLYPRTAREQGWQGKVVLRAHITAEGTIKRITVQKSSGFSVLDDSAKQAVGMWSFKPAQNGEFAVASVVDLPIQFDLLQ